MDARILMFAGFIALLIGIVLIIIAGFLGGKDSDSKVAVGGIIGFIPFGFGTDKRLVLITIIIAVVAFIIFFLMRFLR